MGLCPLRLVALQIFPQIVQGTSSTGLSPLKWKEEKYGTGGVRSGTILLKPDWIHWNAIFHQEWG